jgi:hypothetical protein
VECCNATANFFNLKEYFMHFNPETKTYKLFNALYNGEAVSASQAEKRFGIKNISVLKSAVFAKLVMLCMPTAAKQATASSHRVCDWQAQPQIGCRWLPSNGTWFGLNQLAVLIKQNTHDKSPATCRVFS